MYSENYVFKCSTNFEFLKQAFGIEDKSMRNYDVDLGDYKLLIISIDKKQKYNNIIRNDEIEEINIEKNNKSLNDNRIILIVSKTSIGNRLYEYKFLGYYRLHESNKEKKIYKHLDFYDYDKIFFCYPMYSKKSNKYVIKIQHDSYRYDDNLRGNYKINPEYCIGKNELNTSDYIYENMKLIALEYAVNNDKYSLTYLKKFDYSDLEEKLFQLAYSNIDAQVIGNPDEIQNQILIESSELVKKFIDYMGD